MTDPISTDPISETPTGDNVKAGPTRGFPWHDRLLLLLMLTYVVLLGCLWGAHLKGTLHAVKITPFDTIVPPGAETALSAKFERDGPGLVNPDLEEAAIRLVAVRPNDWAQPATVTTGDDGIARHELHAPDRPGQYFFRGDVVDAGRFSVRDPEVVGGVFVVAKDRPLIICDIDDTITAGGGWRSLMRGHGPDALLGAAATLRELQRQHQIVFLTARDDALLNRTRSWLVEERFPYPTPVICRDWTLRHASRAGEAKLASLKKLQENYENIPWGIGNSEGDCEAYRAAGIPHLSLEGGHCQQDGKGPTCRGVENWQDIRAILLKD